MITLISIDGQEIQTSQEISNMIETIDLTKEKNELPIKMSSLKIIVDYCEYHSFMNPPEIVKPMQSNDFTECILDSKDAERVLQLDIERCLEMVNDCLIIKCSSLYKLFCARIGYYFKVTPVKELKSVFGLTTSKLSKQEIAEVSKTNSLLSKVIV